MISNHGPDSELGPITWFIPVGSCFEIFRGFVDWTCENRQHQEKTQIHFITGLIPLYKYIINNSTTQLLKTLE